MLVALPAFAQKTNPTGPPDKENLSYALGMNLALDMKNAGVEVDSSIVAKAIQDVLQDKPTDLQESQIPTILKQAETMGRFKLASKNIAEGEMLMSKNALAKDITLLPDGLEYRVLQTGTGNLPRRIEIVTLKFRGSWMNGKEFKHNDRLEIPLLGCTKGLQEALLKMKVGSRWQVFIPYNLAYGRVGEQAEGYGQPLVYDLELLNSESENAHPNQHHGAGRLGHTLDEDVLPDKFRPAAQD